MQEASRTTAMSSRRGGRGEQQEDEKGGRGTPDFGTAYVPNAGDAKFAPKALDHFKRGYEERAIYREKEFYTRKHGPTGRESYQDVNRNERPTIVQGLDINQVVNNMTPKLHDKRSVFAELDNVRHHNAAVFENGKAMTAMISVAARRKNIGMGHAIWDWMDHARLPKNTYHYNSMITVAEKARDHNLALKLLDEMTRNRIPKNEVTFSSAISACEKCGEWKIAMDLLESMEREGVQRTAIAYNAAISACEKGMVPQKACEVFQRMKREGISPSVVSYSALISAAEKGGQWKLALEILEEMKEVGLRGNVVAYSAAISALAKGQQWRRALELFREIQSHGGTPSIVTYNATMTALEKGMQWERALDLFEEMKMRNLPITVVSYGSAISACDKGFQYRQCLEFLDEMTEMGIQKNVIIFGAAMSCMEKCSRADIGFELMKRMKEEGIDPNVHIYNSAISACARSNLWEKGYELYQEMERVGVKRDVVTYNAVLDAVSSQIPLGRKLFQVGVEKGFYAKVSRLGEHWFELDLHFLSLGGGEIALGWWFEECLVPYLQDTDKLKTVKSISIVTGYGKTRTRGRRFGDDGMRKRCKAMLRFMNIDEHDQTNAGRIHVNKDSLIEEVKKNGGKIIFDLDGYIRWKETETTANVIPDTEQKIRARFKPKYPGGRGPPFVRIENESTSEEYRFENQQKRRREEDDLRESDYRSDIDYAERDGIRFELGTQTEDGRPPPHDRQDNGSSGRFRDGNRLNGPNDDSGRPRGSFGRPPTGRDQHYGPSDGGRPPRDDSYYGHNDHPGSDQRPSRDRDRRGNDNHRGLDLDTSYGPPQSNGSHRPNAEGLYERKVDLGYQGYQEEPRANHQGGPPLSQKDRVHSNIDSGGRPERQDRNRHDFDGGYYHGDRFDSSNRPPASRYSSERDNNYHRSQQDDREHSHYRNQQPEPSRRNDLNGRNENARNYSGDRRGNSRGHDEFSGETSSGYGNTRPSLRENAGHQPERGPRSSGEHYGQPPSDTRHSSDDFGNRDPHRHEDRKRPYEEPRRGPPQERRPSNRGYALDPMPQRRRLS